MLQGFGIGAGKERKEAGQSPTVFPFGFHPFRTPLKGATARSGESLGLMLKRGDDGEVPRRRIYATNGLAGSYTSNSSTLSAMGSVPSVT
jgi:hypothetical protein